MAHHRTKQDKMNAQVHRIEKANMYSLSDMGLNSSLTLNTSKKNSATISSENFGVDMSFVKLDLLRTLIATIVIVALLVAGFYFLR